MKGKVRAALSNNAESGPIDIIDGTKKTVEETLMEEHPQASPANHNVVLSPENGDNDFHPVIFDSINAKAIRSTALKIEGSAGPSGLDAFSWRRMCTAFGEKSIELCSAIAAFARKVSTQFVDQKSLMAYTSARLVPLNKNPGVRPIGVGEVVRRIVGKAIMRVVKHDLQDAVGCIQLCAGQDAGCEAAVDKLFNESDMEAMILVDATNAFNQLNRQVTLLNCNVICPAMTCILINTYRNHSNLYVDGKSILSKEGTTQGDPLAMAMFAIGIIPLIQWHCQAAAASSLLQLRRWWDVLNELGSMYGYILNHNILAKPQHLARAQEIFKDTPITISVEGTAYLGGAMGTNIFAKRTWEREIESLSLYAETQPHAAYTAFTHGPESKWSYLL